MAQNAAADNRKVCITTNKIVREDGNKVQQFLKGGLVDFHRCMLRVECDAMLVIVNIGTVLHKPRFTADRNGNNPVILSCRMIHAAFIAFILHAKQALGITGLRCSFCCCNCLGILFGFTQIDGNIQIAILGSGLPANIFLNAITPDVIRVLRELIEPVCSSLRILRIQFLELIADLTRRRCKNTHQFGIVQISACDIIRNDTFIHCIVQQTLQNLVQRHGPDVYRFKAVQLLGSKQLVYNKRLVAWLNKFLI